MIPKVIKTEKDYESALARINDLMDADPGTPEGDELELLVTLVELYEKAKHPIDLPDPVEAIKFRMEQLGLKQKDLIPLIGSRSKVSEVLSRQRPLSITMIRKLNVRVGHSGRDTFTRARSQACEAAGRCRLGPLSTGGNAQEEMAEFSGDPFGSKEAGR